MNVKTPPTIQVIGTGEVLIMPNTAQVILGVNTEGKELSFIQKENATIINRILATLARQGLTSNLIQTSDYRIEPIYDFKENEQFLRGYKVTHLLQVKIRDTNKIGDIIDSTVQSGANNITGIYFTTENEDHLYHLSLKKAMIDAYHKALSIADTFGVRLCTIPIIIEEETNRVFPAGRFVNFAAEATPIMPGQQRIEATLKAVYTYY
jgi:uncharacterized protein YggE